MNVSLAAKVLLLNVDPAKKGLLCASRRRLREALEAGRAIDQAEGGHLRGGAIAAARRELVEAGLVTPARLLGNVRLTDSRAAASEFRALLHAIERCAPGERDVDLLLLLATSGALAARLSTAERGVVAQRLRAVLLPAVRGRDRAPGAVRALEDRGVDVEDALATFELRDAGGTLTGFVAYGGRDEGSPTKWMQ